MKHEDGLWYLGFAISVLAGIALSQQYNMAIGISAGYAMCILVDIRRDISKIRYKGE